MIRPKNLNETDSEFFRDFFGTIFSETKFFVQNQIFSRPAVTRWKKIMQIPQNGTRRRPKQTCKFWLDRRSRWAILPERVHHWRNILSCTAKTSKHLIKNNIGQFICILWPSFDHKNIFDKLNRFLRYRHIKMRQWWNAEFHRFCILIWWYLKNIFSLSRTFCWAKLGQSVWLNCPIFLLAKCLLVSAMQDKMWQKKWKKWNCPNSI